MMEQRAVSYLATRPACFILVLATLALALAAGMNAFANSWRQHRPDLVLALFPGDPIATLNAEDHRWTAALGAPGRLREAATAAHRALRDEPLNPAAFRLLGFAEASQQHIDRARALMRLAHQLSRRDAATSVWLIHDSAARGDMQATLLHYDEALRTSTDTAEVLFPPLAAALFDPAVRHALSIYVRTRPGWMPRFLRFAADTDTPDHVARLVIETGGLPHSSEYDGLDARILARLAERSSFALAQSYLQRVLGIAPNAVSDPAFTSVTTDPRWGPFAWRFIDEPAIGSALDDQRMLQVRAATDAQGIVAKRLLIAGAGAYDFIQSVTFAPGMPAARLRWEVRCMPATSGEPIWTQDLRPGSASAKYTVSLIIPDHCPVQELVLIAGNDNAQGEAQATVGMLALRRH